MPLIHIKSVLNNIWVYILIYVILLDIFGGLVCAFKNKVLNSHIGIVGMLKHLLVIFLVLGFGMIAPTFELQSVYQGFIIFFIVQYGISITESLLSIDFPVPTFICDLIYTYKEKYPKKETKN